MMEAEAALDVPAIEVEPFGLRAVRAAYLAFVLWVPIETLYVFDAKPDGSSGGFTVSKGLGLIMFGLALVEWRRCFKRIPASFWLIAWYLAVYAVSELWIPRYLGARFRASEFTMIQMTALFVISANLFADSEFRGMLLRFYGWWSGLVAGAMLLGVFAQHFQDIESRTSLLGEDPNFSAGLLALGAVCIAGNPRLFLAKGRGPRVAAAMLAIGALIAAILQTGSRGGLLAFIVGFAALAVCGGKGVRATRALIAAGVLGMLGVFIVREFQQGTSESVRIERSWTDGDTAGRTQIWNVATAMFWEKPLLGYGGTNNFATLGRRLSFDDRGIYYRDTHNLLLAVMTEVGIVGGFPFLVAILYLMWGAWRHGRNAGDATPFALMCTLVMMNSSITGYHQKIFWIVLAAAAAAGADPSPVVELSGARPEDSA